MGPGIGVPEFASTYEGELLNIWGLPSSESFLLF